MFSHIVRAQGLVRAQGTSRNAQRCDAMCRTLPSVGPDPI
jgi:hypothetical protein